MIERKKKIKIIQVALLLVGMLIIFFTYIKRENISDEKIISSEAQKKIKRQMESKSEEDIFYNIEYSGLDLAGNRYILKANEATPDKSNQDIINMKSTTAIFYFKDGTVLKVKSKKGVYNNKTLDIKFKESVKANYQESSLYANEANYSNSESYLSISGDVKIKDIRGEIFTDNLFFDLKKQTVDIKSSNENNVKTNIKVNEKKF